MPEIVQEFNVDQSVELVWDFFQDIPRVVSCMPGLEYLGSSLNPAGEEVHRGKIKIKLGLVSAAFEGEAVITATQLLDRSASIEGKGIDKRGGSRASASVNYKIREKANVSTVEVKADIKLSGALAQIGRTGIVQDVANQITEQFADNLRVTLGLAAKSHDSATNSALRDLKTEIRTESLLLNFILKKIKWLFKGGKK